jgi:proline iminopeptidase
MERVQVREAELWTDTTGRGDTAVVLLHGGPGLSDNLSPIASMIDDIALMHRYDQRGGGRSGGNGPFTVARFVEDLDALRAHWDHQSWVVMGHSWGGWLALMHALRHPSRVTALVGIGVPPPPSEGWSGSYRAIRDSRLADDERLFFDEIRDRRRAGDAISDDEERRWVHLNWRTNFVDRDALPDFAREPLFSFPMNYSVNIALNTELDAFAVAHDLAAELATITAPAMFIHGRGDPHPPPFSVVRSLPRARFEWVDGAGHLPWLERPADVADTLRRFLSGVG